MIRVLLADDQALVRGALAALLSLEPDLEVVAEVGSGDEVLDAVRRHRPDVALLDVEMPGLNGIAATAAVRAAFPDVRVLIVTTFGRPGYLRRALQAGASGFVVKDTPAAKLADAVRRVHAGLRVVDPVLATGRGRGRGDRLPRVPQRGDGAQPPLDGDRQDRRGQPGGGRPDRRGERLALTARECANRPGLCPGGLAEGQPRATIGPMPAAAACVMVGSVPGSSPSSSGSENGT